MGIKVIQGFCGLGVPENSIECVSLTVISIDFSFVYDSTYYLQIYLDNCAYEIVDKQMADYINDNLFRANED